MTRLDRQERALWLKLAKLWDKPKRDRNALSYGRYVRVGKSECRGLCHCVLRLTRVGARRERMLDKIRDRMSDTHYPYNWPLTIGGARSRAAFCRRQARALERAA